LLGYTGTEKPGCRVLQTSKAAELAMLPQAVIWA